VRCLRIDRCGGGVTDVGVGVFATRRGGGVGGGGCGGGAAPNALPVTFPARRRLSRRRRIDLRISIRFNRCICIDLPFAVIVAMHVNSCIDGQSAVSQRKAKAIQNKENRI
jgi:hypothetical protein